MTDESDDAPQNDSEGYDVAENRDEQQQKRERFEEQLAEADQPWTIPLPEYETRADFVDACNANFEKVSEDFEDGAYQPVLVSTVVVYYNEDGEVGSSHFISADPTIAMSHAPNVLDAFNTELIRASFDVGIRDAVHNEGNNNPFAGANIGMLTPDDLGSLMGSGVPSPDDRQPHGFQ